MLHLCKFRFWEKVSKNKSFICHWNSVFLWLCLPYDTSCHKAVRRYFF